MACSIFKIVSRSPTGSRDHVRSNQYFLSGRQVINHRVCYWRDGDGGRVHVRNGCRISVSGGHGQGDRPVEVSDRHVVGSRSTGQKGVDIGQGAAQRQRACGASGNRNAPSRRARQSATAKRYAQHHREGLRACVRIGDTEASQTDVGVFTGGIKWYCIDWRLVGRDLDCGNRGIGGNRAIGHAGGEVAIRNNRRAQTVAESDCI